MTMDNNGCTLIAGTARQQVSQPFPATALPGIAVLTSSSTLALAPCARTRYSTGHRTPYNQAALACAAHGAGQHRDWAETASMMPRFFYVL